MSAVMRRERQLIVCCHAEGASAYCLLSCGGSVSLLSAVIQREPEATTPASDANPAKRIASEKEEQGSGLRFRRKAEAKPRGLCDDAIPQMVLLW